MKKNLITLAILSGAAFAGQDAQPSTGGAFMLYGHLYNLNVPAPDGVVKRQMNSESNAGEAWLTPMSDGVRGSLTWTGGTTHVIDPAHNWQNTKALEEMNQTTGLDITTDFLNNLDFVGTRTTGHKMALTLDFSKANMASDTLVFYVVANSWKGSVGGLTVDGLSNFTVESAASNNTGGFNGKFGGYDSFTLFKVTGTLTDTSKVTFGTVAEKNGFAFASYTTVAPVPEPTTATLSLLALAGLAARRRRK